MSTRKLVLETAKFNVLTAHDSREAAELFSRARELVSALVVTTDIKGFPTLISQVKKERKDLPVILLSPAGTADNRGADYHLSSHEPHALLELCRKLFGDPREVDKKASSTLRR